MISPVNPRHSIHPPSVQQAPPSYGNPKKRLSHTLKYGRSKTGGVDTGGVVNAIAKRCRIQRKGW